MTAVKKGPVLMGVLLVGLSGCEPPAKLQTSSVLSSLKLAAEAMVQENPESKTYHQGEFVDSLFGSNKEGIVYLELPSELVEGGKIFDTWGNPLDLQLKPGRFLIKSLGRDGKAGTADDLTATATW